MERCSRKEKHRYGNWEKCITFSKTDSAEKLIRQLKRNSSVGKKEVRELEIRLQQPYVRAAAKIGRNDPCGSGKKYKKCCGRNE